MSLYIIILCDDQIKFISKLLKKTYPLNAVFNLTTTVHQSLLTRCEYPVDSSKTNDRKHDATHKSKMTIIHVIILVLSSATCLRQLTVAHIMLCHMLRTFSPPDIGNESQNLNANFIIRNHIII